ncbi:MAG: geranylgeranyl reductase family protein [Candidatus Micrarchaeia archaeon]
MSENIFYDCIVVGGGPGGSTAAAFLAKKGKKVLILEKERWPRDKTCGDGISGKSIAILRELGLLETLDRADHGSTTGLTFSSPNGKALAIKFGGGENAIKKGYVCRRFVYDRLLWQNAQKCGADAIEGAAVGGVVREGGKICGVSARMADGSEAEYRGKMVIGADGVASAIAREVRGAEVDPQHTCLACRAYYSGVRGMDGTIEIHFVKSIMPGYFWIFPLENGLANVGVGMMMSDVKAHGISLQHEMEEIIGKHPFFAERFAGAKALSPVKAWSLPFGSKKRKVHTDNVLLVGDAAGLVDPFSGEGIGNAMLSGKLAAEAACEALDANDTGEGFLSRYPERLWAAIWNELTTSYTMQKLGRREWLLNFVINKANSSERARDAITGTITSEKAKAEYRSPLFYLKLLLS